MRKAGLKTYRITVRCSHHEQTPLSMHVSRPDAAGAVDAAQRYLRLTRNVKPANVTYDTWDVYELVPPTYDGRMIQSGTWMDARATLDSGANGQHPGRRRSAGGYAGPFGDRPQ